MFGVLAAALAPPVLAPASALASALARTLPVAGREFAAPSLQNDDSGLRLAQRERRKGKRRDHDRARDAVGSGDVLPLRKIMARVGRNYPGRLLDAELGRNGQGRWIYRLKLLSPGDRVRHLSVDARTGQVLGGGRR